MKRLGTLPRSTRINQNRTIRRHHQSEGRVVGEVLGASLRLLSDDGPYPVCNGLHLKVLRLQMRRRKAGCIDRSNSNEPPHADNHSSSLTLSGKPPA